MGEVNLTFEMRETMDSDIVQCSKNTNVTNHDNDIKSDGNNEEDRVSMM